MAIIIVWIVFLWIFTLSVFTELYWLVFKFTIFVKHSLFRQLLVHEVDQLSIVSQSLFLVFDKC
jgi:hypothetical protein